MPYIKDTNNEDKYIPSKYAKEELPTWEEIYNQFYKNKIWNYDINDESHQTPDLYWKLPHRKMLLGWICNQFNKMLFEDGMKDHMMSWISNNITSIGGGNVIDMHFTIIENNNYESQFTYDNLPLIYTCEIPSTGDRSIFASDLPSKNIKSFIGVMQLVIIVESDNGVVSIMLSNDKRSEEIYWAIVSELIKDVIAYFEGGFVGWKDANGQRLIDELDIKPGCGYQAGVDAAL